jgi:hypothetical protein
MDNTFSIRLPKAKKEYLKTRYKSVNKALNSALNALELIIEHYTLPFNSYDLELIKMDCIAYGLNEHSSKEIIANCSDLKEQILNLNDFQFFILKDCTFNQKH